MTPTDELNEVILCLQASGRPHFAEVVRRLVARVRELEKERDDSSDAIDANWVTHQSVIATRRRAESAEARVRELEANILDWVDHTADGVPVPQCDKLYCPKCKSPVEVATFNAYCHECPNPDDGDLPHQPPLPLFIESCLSSPRIARRGEGATPGGDDVTNPTPKAERLDAELTAMGGTGS